MPRPFRSVSGAGSAQDGVAQRALSEEQPVLKHQSESVPAAVRRQRMLAMITSGASVILDVGTTTTTAIARALAARTDLDQVVVVTNGLNIALELEPAIPRFTVLVTGGTLRRLQHSLVEPLATVLLERIHADLAFVGCNGIDVEHGVTNLNLPEQEIKTRMIASASRAIVVADSSKVG